MRKVRAMKTLQEDFDKLIAAVKSGHTQSWEAFLAMMNFIAKLGENHDRLQQQHAQLKKDFDVCNKERKDLRPQVDRLQAENHRLGQEQLQERSLQHLTLKLQYDQLKKDSKEADDRHQNALDHVTELAMELSQLKEDYKDSQEELAEAKMQLAQRERDSKYLREENLRLKDREAEANTSRASFDAQYQAARAEVDRLKDKVALLKRMEETSPKNSTKIVQELEESRAEGAFLRSEKSRLTEDREALQRSLTETQNQAIYYFNQHSQTAKDLTNALFRETERADERLRDEETLQIETTDPLERELEKVRRDLSRVRKFATRAGKRLRELRELGPAPFLGRDDAQATLNEALGAGLVKVEDAGFTYDRRGRVIAAEYTVVGEPATEVDQAIRLLTPKGFTEFSRARKAFSPYLNVHLCRT